MRKKIILGIVIIAVIVVGTVVAYGFLFPARPLNCCHGEQYKTQLPIGTKGIQYSTPLNIAGVTRENLDSVVDSKELPAGLSITLMELPCAPIQNSPSDYCLPQPYLTGIPNNSGSYHFTVTTSSMKMDYYLQIK